MEQSLLFEFLEEKYHFYNRPSFIETDPISIPSLFSKREDIEIIGFITATISWGNRRSIITNGHKLANYMGQSPFDFVMSYDKAAAQKLKAKRFVHRTFNADDLHYFICSLQHIYTNYGGLEAVFASHLQKNDLNLKQVISGFGTVFCSVKTPGRTAKHIAKPQENSAAKRINMYLRWMVRQDQAGVDFGLWKKIKPSLLSIPLDVHSGRVARKLGLLQRSQNDWKAVEELDAALRKFDAKDPVKYDFALFGLGVFENF
jgi:uncharacterized protein (TIGR02757 family)